ncbi:MAG: UDPGP type 1 family protein [Planctomycetota bacterium]
MNQVPNHPTAFESCSAILNQIGQYHLLQWWTELSTEEQRELLADINSVQWNLLQDILETVVARRSSANPTASALDNLQPAKVFPQKPTTELIGLYDEAIEAGRSLLRSGKVAAFTVAGGQGTRLGFDGPKGMVPVTPVGSKSLFEIFATTVLAARRKFGANIPWYIMTSPANHEQTVNFLRTNRWFGLPEQDVILFSQGMLPAFDFQGRALLAAKHRLALAPDGHGGSLDALIRSGALADCQRRGITLLSYFQVDNPLVKPFDPLFIGLHSITGSEMSTKVCAKADDLERVGNVCLQNGKVTVIEYSEFPEKLARQRDLSSRRTFDAGNLAIHLLDIAFIDRVISKQHKLPFRRAEKIVPHIDEQGRLHQPAKPNAVKLEKFIFDVLPFATNPLVLEVDRAEEFSPVKNATGVDSLETSKRDQNLRACRWLESVGVRIPRHPDGTPNTTVTISPLFALDPEEIRSHVQQIPAIQPGQHLHLE